MMSILPLNMERELLCSFLLTKTTYTFKLSCVKQAAMINDHAEPGETMFYFYTLTSKWPPKTIALESG